MPLTDVPVTLTERLHITGRKLPPLNRPFQGNIVHHSETSSLVLQFFAQFSQLETALSSTDSFCPSAFTPGSYLHLDAQVKAFRGRGSMVSSQCQESVTLT